MTHAIDIRGLHYRAGRSFEIPSLDLRVPTGAIYGFLGPNGSGKTTTIRLVLGLLRPRAGDIRVLDRPMPQEGPGRAGARRLRARAAASRYHPHRKRGAPVPGRVLPNLGSRLGRRGCWWRSSWTTRRSSGSCPRDRRGSS